jgi:hypothetical protein
MADRGTAHAASSDALKTYATTRTDGHDHVVRRLQRRNWHGLNRRSQGQHKSENDNSEHVHLRLVITTSFFAIFCPSRKMRLYAITLKAMRVQF